MKIPSKQTLKKYGLTEQDYIDIWQRQGERCPICGRSDEGVLMVVDHEHAPRWKKMPPEKRKTFVRGIICSYDNQRIVGRGATYLKLIRGAIYLGNYEKRKQK